MDMLYTIQLANSLQSRGRDAWLKERPTFLAGRRNLPTICKYDNIDLLKTVVAGVKEGDCVCTVKHVLHQWKTFEKKSFFFFDAE